MLAILQSLGTFIIDLFKSRCLLEAENLFLCHQLRIALRRAPPSQATATKSPASRQGFFISVFSANYFAGVIFST
jgi:hypothetical protein